jgi:rSAM/selenodomain-associated transferase 2
MTLIQHVPRDPTPTPAYYCSVIIPTLNEAAQLPTTLRRLTETMTEDCEIIIVDGGSTDDTTGIARRSGARVIDCTRGRALQMNAGARVARGENLYFLHADTLPPTDWLERLKAHGNLPCCFRLKFMSQSPLLRLYGWFTRFDVDAFRFGDQSLWVRKVDFEAVGGFPEWQLLEDNYLVRRLRERTGGFRILDASVTTSPRKYVRNGFAYTQAVYVLLYTLYRLGAGQRLLVGIYRRLLD